MTLQNYGAFDQALIQLLADSRCPDDHLNLVKHIYNRPGPQGRLLQLAERDRNHHKATSLWPRAQQFLLDLAQGGNALAMFHLGRWHRLGIGCNPNPEQATQWCEMGAQLGHTGCMITLARLVLKESPEQARAWLQQAQQQDQYNQLLKHKALCEKQADVLMGERLSLYKKAKKVIGFK